MIQVGFYLAGVYLCNTLCWDENLIHKKKKKKKRCFGAPEKYIKWVKECITKSRLSVAINGTLVGYFEGGRGLKQGYPISPYLFL